MKLPELIIALSDDKTGDNVEYISAKNLSARNNSDDSSSDADDDGQREESWPKIKQQSVPSGINVNKTMLYKLRYERLQAVEKADGRSLNMRLNSSGLNSSEVKVKYRTPPPPSESENYFNDLLPSSNKNKMAAVEKLLFKIPAENNTPNWEEYKNLSLIEETDLLKQTIVRLYETIASKESLGICEKELIVNIFYMQYSSHSFCRLRKLNGAGNFVGEVFTFVRFRRSFKKTCERFVDRKMW